MRGEKDLERQEQRLKEGPTPRTRGKATKRLTTTSTGGNNPTYAGKSAETGACLRRCPGFNPACAGKRAALALLYLAEIGNNPAYAGKRRRRRATTTPAWEQPRVRGEKRGPCHAAVVDHGTTPRMRGKDFVTCEFVDTLSSSRLTCSHHDTGLTVPSTTTNHDTSPNTPHRRGPVTQTQSRDGPVSQVGTSRPSRTRPQTQQVAAQVQQDPLASRPAAPTPQPHRRGPVTQT